MLRRLGATLVVMVIGCAGTLDDPERFRIQSPLEPTDAATGADVAALVDAGADAATSAVANPNTSCADVPQSVFARVAPTGCTTAGCHSAASKAGGLDLESSGLPARIVGAAATGGPGLLIDPANPGASVMLAKLKTPPPFGGVMPPSAPLDDATLACVQNWVFAAAAADAGAP
jgi:hypothetical protein